MNHFEYKSLKVLQKVIQETESNDIDVIVDYVNRSENIESDMVVSVFVSTFDYYRATIPYVAFGEAGGNVMITRPLAPQEVKFFEDSNFFILSKIISEEYFDCVYHFAKKIGAIIVFDLDDNLHEIAPSNSVFNIYNQESDVGKSNLCMLEKNISKCDCVIYSTRELQSYYQTLNPNSIVVPNFLDLNKRYKDLENINWRDIADDQNVEYYEDSVLVGFFGSNSHVDDLSILELPILQILNENPKVIFAIMTGQELILNTLIKEWKIPYNRFLFFPYKNINNYLQYVKCFDIGLAPLQTTLFNTCKSNLKVLEYGALGIPYIASKVANFQRFQVESKGIGGFICDSDEEWYEKINFLISNPEIRKKMGQDLKQYVYKHYDIDKSMVLLTNVLRTIYENHNKLKRRPNIFELADCYDNIPQVKILYTEEDKCPCGSGQNYISCKNNCYPAWGEIIKEDKCQSNN